MISSAPTLFLAALIMTTSVFGAPIRLSVAPSEVAARAESAPELVAKAVTVVDVQPIHKRSELGRFSRRSARLITEREPLPETLEVPVARNLVEEPQVQRRYPRRVYYERHEPQPEPVNVPAPAPVIQKREEHQRVYPRRVYYEHYEKRAPSPEPAIKIKETTTTVSKISTFDSPEDLAAANNNQLISGGFIGNTLESTLISFSQTQTIESPGSDATATVVTVTGTGAVATATAADVVTVVSIAGTGTDTTAPATITESVVVVTASPATGTDSAATSTITESAVVVTASPATGTDSAAASTITESVVVVTASAAATDSAVSTVTESLVTVTGTPSTTSSSATATATSTSTATSGDTSDTADPQPSGIGGTLSFAPAPVRRAYSGATWASFVRRQSN